MKLFRILIGALILIGLIFVVAAPIGPVPGFLIGGQDQQVPTRWPDTSGVPEIRLKVPGVPPRVVIIWVVAQENELYVVGDKDNGWVKMLGDGSPVEMRLGDNTYALYARRVDEGAQEIVTAWLDKYRPDYPEIVSAFPTPESGVSPARVYRLGRN